MQVFSIIYRIPWGKLDYDKNKLCVIISIAWNFYLYIYIKYFSKKYKIFLTKHEHNLNFKNHNI